MDNTQTVSVGYGKANFRNTAMSLAALLVAPVFNRTTPNKKLTKQGATQVFPVAVTQTEGAFYVETFKEVGAEILLLQAQRTTNGAPVSQAGMFIRLRDTGPLLNIFLKVPAYPGCLIGTRFMAFSGRGDILSVSDLGTFSIEPNPNWLRAYTQAEELAECFDYEVLQQELQPAPMFSQVEMANGEVRVLVEPPRAVRNIRIRAKDKKQ